MQPSVPRGIYQHLDGTEKSSGMLQFDIYRSNSNETVSKEAFYDKQLIVADRDMVETESDEILRDADKLDVALLVVGDPFGYAIYYLSNPDFNVSSTVPRLIPI